jgi:hypothetical protein
VDVVAEVDEEPVRRSSVDQVDHLLPRGGESQEFLHLAEREVRHRLFVGALEDTDAGHGYGQTANRVRRLAH